MRFFIFRIPLILALATAQLASWPVQGVIRDAWSGLPLSDVVLQIDHVTLAQTDSSGYFVFDVQEAPVTVVCIKPNYWITTFELATGRLNSLELPPVAYDMDGIFVFANKRAPNSLRLPVAPLHLEPEHIPSYSSSAQIANLLPGISLKTYGGPAGVSNLSLYGGQGDRIAVLLDGVKLNSEQNGSADISQIPAVLLENVELYPYGASNRFGSSAMTGVVNFNIKNEELKFKQMLGSYGSSASTLFVGKAWPNTTAGIALGHHQFDGSYYYHEDGSYYPAAKGQDFDHYLNRINQDFGYGSLKGHNQHNFIYRLSGLTVKSRRDLSGQIYAQPYLSALNDRLELYTLEIGLPVWRFSTHYKVTELNYRKPAGAGPAINSGSRLATWQNQVIWFRHQSRWGIELEQVRNRSKSVSFGTTSLIDTSRSTLSLTNETTFSFGNLDLTVAGRAELDPTRPTALAWSFSLLRKFNGLLQEGALIVSQNYKKPTFNDLFWEPFGDPTLKTETSRNIYLRQRLVYKDLQFEIDFFYIYYDNLIQWTPQTGATALWRPENIRAGESMGYHFSAGLPITDNLWIDLEFDRDITRNYDHSIGEEHYGKPFYYTPEYLLKAKTGTRILGANLLVNYNWESSRIRVYGSPDMKLPAHGTLDLNLGKTLDFKGISITTKLLLENVLDEQYQLVLGYPQPGRTIAFTLEVKPRQPESSKKKNEI